MRISIFVFMTALVACGLGSAAAIDSQLPNEEASTTRDERPNVIVILADDLGYGDTSVYGSKVIETPHIDALAASGVRFTDGYVTHPVCAPSRAALITGRYQQRFGFEFNPVGRDEETGVDLRELTIAQLMKQEGYRTGMIGKWHLGQARGYYPTDRGFDEYFGMASGGSTYIVNPKPGDEFFSTAETEVSTNIDRTAAKPAPGLTGQAQRLAAARRRFPITRNKQIVDEPDYLTDAFRDEAAEFIDRNSKRPFFLYLAYTAPHTPLQATKRYIDRYRHIEDPGKRVYAAMVSALDDGVGRVMSQLKANGIERKTLVIFLSDNGCAGYLGGACSNAPFSGSKATPLEGGIRVPFIAAMPGRIPSGRVDGRVVSSLDILPTALGLTGVTGQRQVRHDGINLMPYLTGGRGSPNRTLFWRAGKGYALRKGNFKLWSAPLAPPGAAPGYVEQDVGANIKSDQGHHIMLYDLAQDPSERNNLVGHRAGKVRALIREYSKWDAGLGTPTWPSRRVIYHKHDGQILEVRN
jgi:arylsulfatase A-like enzyme